MTRLYVRERNAQREFAARLGWDQRTISKIESGSTRVSAVELIELARTLEFDVPAAVRRVMWR